MATISVSPAAGDDLSCDLLVAGGGAVGLWLARLALASGLRVVLCERAGLGSGASGGLLGALMPHMPDPWNDKKRFQFEALAALPGLIRDLEAETGRATGYRRIGRLMPLVKAGQREHAFRRQAAAETAWGGSDPALSWRIVDAPPAPCWPAEGAMAAGAVLETLSARISPRGLLAALAASLQGRAGVTVLEGEGFARLEGETAVLSTGRRVRAGRIAIAAGVGSFPLIAGLLKTGEAWGRPVKGQAALLAADVPADLPLVFHDGVYAVPHEGGRVAVGSTSEEAFDAPFSTDDKLDSVIARAAALCPALAGAPVVERWAGLRPRAAGPDPMVDRLPGLPRVVVATGGFKITLGIAHAMAAAALDLAFGGAAPGLPESFAVEAHAARATKSRDLGRREESR